MKPVVVIHSVTMFTIFQFRMNLIWELQKKGFEVVALGHWDEKAIELEKNGVKCIDSKNRIGGMNPLYELIYMVRLFFLFLQIRPILVHHFTPKCVIFGVLPAKLVGAVNICTISGLGYAFNLKKTNPVRMVSVVLYYLANLFTDFFIFQNIDDMRFFLESAITSIRKARLILGSGVDLNFYKKTDHHEPPVNPVVFTFIGRLLYEKGIREFLRAAQIIHAKYPDVKFLIAGDKTYDNPSIIREHELDFYLKKNPSLVYLGKLDDVRDILMQTSVFVLPSYYREGLPRSILEAMAYGLPIITTNNIGCRATVREGFNGFLCPCKSHDELARHMEFFITNPEEIKIMGEHSFQRVVRVFESSKVVSKVFSVYSKFIHINSYSSKIGKGLTCKAS